MLNCGCECNRGGFCGGCGHVGCSGGINVRPRPRPEPMPVRSRHRIHYLNLPLWWSVYSKGATVRHRAVLEGRVGWYATCGVIIRPMACAIPGRNEVDCLRCKSA